MQHDSVQSTSKNRKMSSMTLKDWGFNSDVCHKCGKHNNDIGNFLLQCGKCKLVYYCSKQCFNDDIIEHQKICGTAKLDKQPERTLSSSSSKKSVERNNQQHVESDSSKPSEFKKKVTDRYKSLSSRSKVQNTEDVDVVSVSSKSTKSIKPKKPKKKEKEKDKDKEKKSARTSLLDIEDSSQAKSKKKDKKKGERMLIEFDRTPSGAIIVEESAACEMTTSGDDQSGSDDCSDTELNAQLGLDNPSKQYFTTTSHQDFLQPHTMSFVDPQHMSVCDAASFDDNSIMSDLAGTTIKVIEFNNDDSDSESNLSDVTFEGVQLLGDDDDDDSYNDDDSFLWEGASGCERQEKALSKAPSVRGHFFTSCVWNGRKLTKDVEQIREKEISKSNKLQRSKSIGQTILAEETPNSKFVNRRQLSHTKSLEELYPKPSMKRNNSEKSNDILNAPNHVPEYLVFDKEKLNKVETKEKKEYAWLVPEWVNGVLLRQKLQQNGNLAGEIVYSIEVLPEDPDYYDEGEIPPGTLGTVNQVYNNNNKNKSSKSKDNKNQDGSNHSRRKSSHSIDSNIDASLSDQRRNSSSGNSITKSNSGSVRHRSRSRSKSRSRSFTTTNDTSNQLDKKTIRLQQHSLLDKSSTIKSDRGLSTHSRSVMDAV